MQDCLKFQCVSYLIIQPPWSKWTTVLVNCYICFIFCKLSAAHLLYAPLPSTKELSLCSHKLKFFNPYIIDIRWCKPVIFQTLIIGVHRIHSLKYLRSITSLCRKLEIGVCGKDSIPFIIYQVKYLYNWRRTRWKQLSAIEPFCVHISIWL